MFLLASQISQLISQLMFLLALFMLYTCVELVSGNVKLHILCSDYVFQEDRGQTVK